MPLPVAFPLASFLTRAGITALGTGAATEGIKSLQNQGVVNPNMAQQALMRTIMGPTSEIFNRTTDTPSGKVFAPDATDIEKQRKEAISKPLITPMPVGQQDQTLATPVPEKTTILPGMNPAPTPIQNEGFNMPTTPDTSILTKDKVSNQPKELLGENLSASTTLDKELLNDLLVTRGGIEGFEEKMNSGYAPMPNSTKKQMEIQLQNKLFDKYKINTYPDGVNPDELSEAETQKFKNKYTTQLQGIDFITSAAYDAIGERTTNNDIARGYPVFAIDNEGLPIAGAKIKKYTKSYIDTSIEKTDDPKARIKRVEALYIAEIGSINYKATTKLLDTIAGIAKENNISYVVAEDFTSKEAFEAFKNRGYESTSKKDYQLFKGEKIRRDHGSRLILQKNLVLKIDTDISKQTDAPGEEENTSKSAGSLTEEVLKMKTTKGEYSHTYNIAINNSVYEVEQREDNNPNKEWTINLLIDNGVENQDHDKWADTVNTLKYAKESILRWENTKNLNQAKTIANEFTASENTSKSAGSLTEVSTNPSEPFDSMDTSAVDFFPFNPVDFKKNGILNNPEIVKAFDDLKNDVKIKPPVGFNEDYMALQQSDSFYLTPPRAQMEITLKYLEKQLEENKASEETLNLIKNLNKDLQAKIKDTGYYAENKKVEDRITNLPGMTNKLKNLKSSN